MVKADLSRDYYGDLGLQPGADLQEIKKQFKKLALINHPDRNPGRESEVVAKFQIIQSAHEVLTDTQERAKYDNNRSRSSARYSTGSSAYAGHGTGSGVRGNPWADAGSNFPPPPKHPTARQTPQRPSGADKYGKWQAPQARPNQGANEGAKARQANYEAWENMRSKSQARPQPQTAQAPNASSSRKPQPPPREQRPQQNTRPVPPSPTGYRFDDAPRSSHSRSQSGNPLNRKGFMPNTPGGDEPGAPMGAYFTKRDKPAFAPDLPARDSAQTTKQPSVKRQPPEGTVPATQQATPDPLRQFREQAQQFADTSSRPPAEPRLSTPYSTHGGEKLNPFESANLNRSRSTREPSQRYDADGHVPRTGSDPNLASPNRSKSFADRGTSKTKNPPIPSKVPLDMETDSSEEENLFSASVNRRPFGKPRVRKATTNGASSQQHPDSAPRTAAYRKTPSKISQFQKWYREHPGEEPPLNGFPPDGPPLRTGQANPQATPQSNGEPSPSMYASPTPLNPHAKRSCTYPTKLPTVAESITSSNENCKAKHDDAFDFTSMKCHNIFTDFSAPVATSSGITEDPATLTPFEVKQRNLVDQLVVNKQSGSVSNPASKTDSHYMNQNSDNFGWRPHPSNNFSCYRDLAEGGSPSKKPKSSVLHSKRSSYDASQARAFWDGIEKIKSAANGKHRDSFSFPINNDTFKPTASRPNAFSSSAENISTKFSEQEWDGKFAAGDNFFKPEPKTSTAASRSRPQSGSRSRGRSPVKPRSTDTPFMQQRGSESETTTVESPGGTKFSAQEWKDTFRPQTFAPPTPRMMPVRKRTGPSIRTTQGGNAAVVDDSETSDEKPLFTGRKPVPSPTVPSPDAMDVDTEPITNTVPQFKSNGGEPGLSVNTGSPKRAAISTPSPDEAHLKVEFADLKIQDLLSTIQMSSSPLPPALPVSHGSKPTQAAYEDYQIRFAKYMTQWDLHNSQFMLNLVTRKNEIDELGTKRWLDDSGTELYRRGLKEDGALLSRWAQEKERHEGVVKEWVIVKEKMKEGMETRPPRKKTH